MQLQSRAMLRDWYLTPGIRIQKIPFQEFSQLIKPAQHLQKVETCNKIKDLEKLPFKVSLPFAPQLFKSFRMFLINSVREEVSKIEAGAVSVD